MTGNGQIREPGVRIGLVGDLLLGRGVSDRIAAAPDPSVIWGDLLPELRATDAMVGNLETPITDVETRWPGRKAYYFRTSPKAADALVAANFKCVSLANNHILDRSTEGLSDTLRHLRGSGIVFSGAGWNASEAAEPTLFQAGELTIGFVSITDQMRSFAAGEGKPGTSYRRIDPDDLGRLAAVERSLRERGADRTILSVHWGPNYRWWPPARYRAFARRAIEAGFDIVHGHSAHILQALEFHQDGLILYDAGNFVNDFRYVVRLMQNDRSFLFVADLTERANALRLVPVALDSGVVNRARGAVAEDLRRRMIRRCRGFAVAFHEEGDDLVARPIDPRAAGGGP